MNSLKELNLKKFRLSPQSHLYNYDYREIMLISERYKSEMDPQMVATISKQSQWAHFKKQLNSKFWVCYALYAVATRRTAWSRLTTGRGRLYLLICGAMLHIKLWTELKYQPMKAIIENSAEFEKVVQLYEKEQGLVY